jgi:hypothetical protein
MPGQTHIIPMDYHSDVVAIGLWMRDYFTAQK